MSTFGIGPVGLELIFGRPCVAGHFASSMPQYTEERLDVRKVAAVVVESRASVQYVSIESTYLLR